MGFSYRKLADFQFGKTVTFLFYFKTVVVIFIQSSAAVKSDGNAFCVFVEEAILLVVSGDSGNAHVTDPAGFGETFRKQFSFCVILLHSDRSAPGEFGERFEFKFECRRSSSVSGRKINEVFCG